MKKFQIIAAFAAIAAISPSLKAATIAGWTFENNSVATNTAPTASTNNSVGTPTAGSIGMTGAFTSGAGVDSSDILVGKSSDTGSNTVADLTNTWRIRAAGGTGTNNGWSTGAGIGTQGIQFGVNTSGFSNIQITFDWYSTSAGEANLQFEYTTNGSIWINAPLTLGGSDSGASIVDNSSGSLANTVVGSYVHGAGGSLGQDWFTGLTANISDVNAANDSSFGFRIVNAATGSADVTMTGAAENNTSGNWRFDNVNVTGAAAVPEPSTYAAIIFGAAFLLVRSSRGRRSNRHS